MGAVTYVVGQDQDLKISRSVGRSHNLSAPIDYLTLEVLNNEGASHAMRTTSLRRWAGSGSNWI